MAQPPTHIYMPTPMHTIAALLAQQPEGAGQARRIVVTTHTTPDGDAIGSSFAFAHVAQLMGAEVRLYLYDGVPPSFAWLTPPCPVVTRLAELEDFTPHLLVTLDCGDAKRPGPELAAYFLEGTLPFPAWKDVCSVNIDHHLGNPGFATHNWVEPAKAATSEMVGDLAEHLHLGLQGGLGQAVYLGLMTDTGKFSFPNTTAHTLHMAARIVEQGLRVAEFTSHHENNWSLGRMRLWGELMHSINLHHNGLIASCVVEQDHLQRNQATKDDLEGFAAQLRCIAGVEVAVFMREDAPSRSKVSLRSVGHRNIRDAAAHFGGGGHKNAAGAEFTLPPQEALERVLEKLVETWE